MSGPGSDVWVAGATREASDDTRHKLLTAIAGASALATQLKGLPPGDVFRVVLSSPVSGGLHLRPDGLYDAFVLDPSGKISAVARLESVGQNLLMPAGILLGQAMFMVVSRQLREIERKVGELKMLVRAEQFGDLQAQFKRLATLRYQGDFKDPTLSDIEGRLSSGLQRILIELRARLTTLPAPRASLLGRARDTLDRSSAAALDECEMLARVAMQALRAYAEAQMLMVAPAQAAQIMKQWIVEFADLPIDRAEALGRSFYAGPADRRREEFWRDTKTQLASAELEIERVLREDNPLRIEMKASGAELARLAASVEVPRGSMQT